MRATNRLRLSGEQLMPLTAEPSPLFRQSGTVVLLMYSSVCAFHWRRQPSKSHTLKKTDSPSQKLSIDNPLPQLGVGLHVQLPSPCWDLIWLEVAQVLCMLSCLQ